LSSAPENREFAEKRLFLNKFPSIKYLPLDASRKANARVYFGSADTFEDIKLELSDRITDLTTPVNEQSLQIQITQSLNANKISLIMFYDSD
jgi:hypothetical protein